MSDTVIKLENISKQYRLGTVGTQTLRGDFQRWWHNVRGKEDPTLKIGASNQLDTLEGEYVWALRDINLEVKQGEVLGIIGKNGAGKSTLLKLLSRVTGPTTGQIKVKGRIASLLEVGTGFHPELTGRENIFLNGAILGMTKPEIRSKFDEIVDFAGVAKYIDTPVKRYSSGMYVRLAFAVAAHLEPDILVVDEVLAVGDAEFQKKAIGKMQDISTGGGRTVLFVSHNMKSVERLCSRALILEDGEIFKSGRTDEIVEFYLSLFKGQQVISNYSGYYELSTHKNKKYNKRYGIQQATVFCDNKITSKIYTGCELRFEIEISSEGLLDEVKLGFVIKDGNGNRVLGLNNFHTAQRYLKIKEKNALVVIQINKFLLYGEGDYSVDLFLGNLKEDYDIILDAFNIFIEKTDLYGSGFFPDLHLNKFLPEIVTFRAK